MTIAKKIVLITGGKILKEERKRRCRLSAGVNERVIVNALIGGRETVHVLKTASAGF